MLDFLFLISAKPVVVTLATIGAILTTFSAAIGKLFTGKDARKNKGKINNPYVTGPTPDDRDSKNKHHRSKASFGSWLNRLGYGIMGISVVLFIIAGFIVDLRG
jgi:hypothetical protein